MARPGGTCWIDDILSVDPVTAMTVASASADMDVDAFMESGCQKFQAFMTDGGAGEQALSLLPVAISLAKGTSVSFLPTSIDVGSDAIVMSGPIVRQ